jgi:molybdopterin-guanine dinucleotide biosynthesis protein MobB
MNMAPVISIVGRSESGKTRLIDRLVPELRKRGYRVGVVKHAQEIEVIPGKDDSRHLEAGAELSVVVSDHELLARKCVREGSGLEEALRLIGDGVDIILCEGFKQSGNPKIEVRRPGNGPPLEGLSGLVAVVSDSPGDTGVRHFTLDAIAGIAGFIENSYIKAHPENLVLYVNEKQIPLTIFPRQIIYNAIMGMVSALKGAGIIKKATIHLNNNRHQSGT